MMKHYVLLLILGMAHTLQAQTNRALIITIGHYPRYSGWEKIHAENDSQLVCEMLHANQYLSQNITLLSNGEATKASVMNALIQLYNITQIGDYVYLHFSCHGQQMMDDNGDEEDGLDESIVLYDASFWYIPGKYVGENHLRDDELGVWIDKLRKKAGKSGQVITVVDACHSGTVNRENENEDYIRGTSAIFAPEGYTPKPGKHQELSLHLVPKQGFSPAIVISACLPGGINYEYYDKEQSKYFGNLTFFFCKTIKQTVKCSKIDDFMDRLKANIASAHRWQPPYMECTSEDLTFRVCGEER